ncbi:MAG: hypothetical protein Q8918_04400 [Bacteroidota bacterium]|nr:hypothetical protein [Bacteroidota bacterium]MDP4212759.1 hypothetical protein [Bacteroidota bacterium]MDP4249336.1 hypothetical protein [Bacteroidota bacterium]
MGINNITLTRELMAALYPDSLVLPTDGETVAKTPGDYRFLGKNLRKICFVVHCPDAVFLPENQLEFLSKILAACHCNMADIALLNAAVNALDFALLKKQLNPEMLFLCGVPPHALPMPETPEPFAIKNFQGISVLVLPSLITLGQDTEGVNQLKKKLWICLRKMFDL